LSAPAQISLKYWLPVFFAALLRFRYVGRKKVLRPLYRRMLSERGGRKKSGYA